METPTLSVYNIEGKEVDTVKLDAAVFDGNVNTDVIYQVVNAYRSNQRKGFASTKTRGEVSGGGSKPWRQKGTGRARVGSIRSPLWRHGGVIFGPHQRDFSYKIPARLKKMALKSALCAKLKESSFTVLDKLILENPKTKEAVKILFNLKIDIKKNKVLLLLDKLDINLKRALRNIDFLQFDLAKDVNAYEILTCKKLIITKDGLQILVKRLKQ